MYTNIQQAISAVKSAYPSLFTKEDVIKLLNDIKIESSNPTGGFDIEELVEAVDRTFTNYDTSDMVDHESVELSMDYNNRIVVEGINVDTDDLHDRVTDTVREFFDKIQRCK
jgi:hypothetical protein